MVYLARLEEKKEVRQMSVISRIESMMEEYSSTEKKLADYIIKNVEKIPTS